MEKLELPPTQGPLHIRCELKRRIGQELRAETPGERQCKDVKQYSKRPSNRQTQDRSSPSGRAKQPICTNEAQTPARSQGRARAGAQTSRQIARRRLQQPQGPRIEPGRPHIATIGGRTARLGEQGAGARVSQIADFIWDWLNKRLKECVF